MGRPPRSIKRVPVLVRFEPDLLARLDATIINGDRQAMIIAAVTYAVCKAEIAKALNGEASVEMVTKPKPTPREAKPKTSAAVVAEPIKTAPEASLFVQKKQAIRAKKPVGYDARTGEPIYR